MHQVPTPWFRGAVTYNVLFSVDANGTVTSNAIFDYENNAFTFSIRVRATSDTNASYEKALTIYMGNQNEAPTIHKLGNITLASLSEDSGL